MITGDLPSTVELDAGYFAQRRILLDTRGTLEISRNSYWGFDIRVITLSHPIGEGVETGMTKPVKDAPVIVKAGAWIGSDSVLYNCIIGERAVVAVGTVVRSCEVAPDTMVAGNPARVIARFRDGAWQYAELKWTVLE